MIDLEQLRFTFCERCNRHMETENDINFQYTGGEVTAGPMTDEMRRKRIAPTISIPLYALCRKCGSKLVKKFIEVVVEIKV